MSDTKTQIIELADKLIRTKGYNGFSFKDISGPLSIRNAAVHYHFPTKELLGIAVLEKELERVKTHASLVYSMPEDEQLKSFIDSFHQKCKNGLACVMGALSSEFETLPASMKEKLQETNNVTIEWVQTLLKQGRKNNTLFFEGKALDKSLQIVGSLMSALLLSRVRGKEAFERIERQLLSEILQEKS